MTVKYQCVHFFSTTPFLLIVVFCVALKWSHGPLWVLSCIVSQVPTDLHRVLANPQLSILAALEHKTSSGDSADTA